MQQDAQKSEAHDATEDATTSPANRTPDVDRLTQVDHPDTPADQARKSDEVEQRKDLFPGDAEVRRDESDFGGPIDIEVKE